MFRPDPSIQILPAQREQVVAIVESINQPQVSIPGKPAQSVQGHLCGIRNPNGSFSIYVALHLPTSGEIVVYVNDRPRLATPEEYREVELEGLQFLESMGFILDNLNFRNLPPEAQDRTLGRIALFTPFRAAAGPVLAAAPALAPPQGSAPTGGASPPGSAPPGPAALGSAALGSAAPLGAVPPAPAPQAPHAAVPTAEDAARLARLLASF